MTVYRDRAPIKMKMLVLRWDNKILKFIFHAFGDTASAKSRVWYINSGTIYDTNSMVR